MASARFSFHSLRRVLVLAGVLGVLGGGATAQTVTLSAPGASDDVVERLESNSLLLRAPEEGTERSAQDIVAAARADYGRLIGVLYEESYFAPVIQILLDGRDAAEISPFDTPPNINAVTIVVETGPSFRLGQADIAPLAPGTEIPSDFAPGERATTPLLRRTTRAALDGWRNQGHATADVDQQSITARVNDAIIDARIRLAPGPVATFGNLIPEGQERMRVERIIEIAGLPTGEVYAPEALRRAEERLRDTGVFSAVSLTERALGPNNTLDITALLDEAPLRRIGIGVEAATDDGVGVTAFWLHRNLLGGGERLRFDGAISGMGLGDDGVDFELSARLDRPATFTPDTTLSFELDIFYLDDPQFTSQGIGGVVSLSHRLSESITVNGGIGLSFNDISDDLGSRQITLLTFPLGVTYDTRDEPLDARSGAYVDLDATPFLPLGDGGGARLNVDSRAYLGLGETARTRLAGRVQAGTLFGSNIADIPPDFVFFSGGSGTVRGQEFQSLGITDSGDTVGGRGFIGLSGEVRHDIGETNFGVVGFADAGLITENAFFGGESEIHAGAGLGIRYATPFGPIRVDLATPIGSSDGGTDLFLYIGIGQAF